MPHFFHRIGQLFRPALGSVKARDVGDAVRAKSECIEHRFAEDDFLLVERRWIEQALVWPWRVKMLYCSRPDSPPVVADDFSRCMEQRDSDEPLKCSWPLVRHTPSWVSRVRKSSPVLWLASGSRRPSVRSAKPS